MDKRKLTIIIEKADGNYSAYCPELPGCVATGTTADETYKNMIDALRFHLEGLEAEGHPVPGPQVIVREALL